MVIKMKVNFDIFHRCPLFEAMTDEDIKAMLGCLGAKSVKYEKGQVIFAEGSSAEYIGIILSGTVQITRLDYLGNSSIVANITPPQVFGESFACSGVKALPVNAVAAEKAEILLIDARKVTHSCGNACQFHAQMINNLLKIVASKNLLFHQKIEVTSKRTTRDKLMTYLLIQAKNRDSKTFSVPFDRQSLADYLEVDRSALSAEISKMRSEGLIDCRRSEFTLLNDE